MVPATDSDTRLTGTHLNDYRSFKFHCLHCNLLQYKSTTLFPQQQRSLFCPPFSSFEGLLP